MLSSVNNIDAISNSVFVCSVQFHQNALKKSKESTFNPVPQLLVKYQCRPCSLNLVGKQSKRRETEGNHSTIFPKTSSRFRDKEKVSLGESHYLLFF